MPQHNCQMVDCAEPLCNISDLFIYWPRVGVQVIECSAELRLAPPSTPLIVIAYVYGLRAIVARDDVDVVITAAGIKALLRSVSATEQYKWHRNGHKSLFVDF